jgi:DnaK suppressor protein
VERRRVAAEHETDVEREHAIPIDDVGDLVDRAETAADREELLIAAEDELERLRLIDDALWRLREGTYGMCLADGGPIPLSRLRAVPWARYCTAHQEQWEAAGASVTS